MLKLKGNPLFGRVRLGLSLSWSGLDANGLADCLETPNLEAAEIPFESAAGFHQRHPDFLFHAGRIVDKSLSQNILSEPAKMRASFTRQLSRLLEGAKARGFSSVSLDLGLETALEDAQLRALALETIRSLAPALLKSSTVLALPCRIPSLVKASYPATLSAFIKDCMVPGVKAALELHPHELPPDFNAQTQIRGMEFDVASVTLMYNADSVKLLKAHVVPWASLLERYGFKGPFFLCPKSGDRSRLSTECFALAKLIASLRKEDLQNA